MYIMNSNVLIYFLQSFRIATKDSQVIKHNFVITFPCFKSIGTQPLPCQFLMY